MQCPYEGRRLEDGTAICNVLTAACGFTVSNCGSICAYCIGGTAWNDADVPQLKPDDKPRMPTEADAMRLVTDSPFFASLYEQSLHGRLVSGDCPKYQEKAPFNMTEAFAKYKAKYGYVDAEDLLMQMYERHARLTEEEGGDTIEVMAAKIAALAEEHEMEEALLEVALAHEKPATALELS